MSDPPQMRIFSDNPRYRLKVFQARLLVSAGIHGRLC